MASWVSQTKTLWPSQPGCNDHFAVHCQLWGSTECIKTSKNPLVMTHIAIENALFIVDLPISL